MSEKITPHSGEKWYRKNVDPVLGYAPGTIIRDDIDDFRAILSRKS